MRLRKLFALLFMAVAVAVSCGDADVNNGGNDDGGEVVEPSKPVKPAYVTLGSNFVVADYDGAVKSVAVEATMGMELEISTTAEWIMAERIDDELVVTIDKCASQLEREGSVCVKVGADDNKAEATIRVLQIGTDTDELIYDVEIAEAEYKVVAAPILTSANGGKMTVDWGDGSELESYESRRAAHTYAQPGLYTIVISGEDIHNLEFSDGSHVCPELKRIHSWGNMGYKNAANMCKGCVNLESIPSDVAGSFADVGSFIAAFLGCEKLSEIPAGLFRHAVEAKKFSNCFRYTTSLSAIPEDLFANSPLAEEFYYTFYGAGTDFKINDEALKINAGDYHTSYPAELEQSIADGKLRSVPAALFSSCPNATRFEYLFAATAIETIPETIFAANSKVENFQGTFYACMNLQSIPAKLMEKATAALNIKYLFAGCVSLTEIPVAMFENCTEVTNLEAIFYMASGIKSAKKDTFKGLSKVKTIGSVFQGCASLTDVEAGVFDGLTSAKSFPYCFADCTSLRTIPEELLAGMNAAYEFESMFANTALESVPEGLFDEVRDYDLGDYAYIFAECKNLKTVPAKLFDHVTEASSGGFNNIFYKSGIETIPAGLFTTCTKVDATSFEAVFMGCPELHTVEGSIFPEVTTITSMRQIFYNCPKLVNIPADLFKPFGTAKLKFTNAFTGCTSLKSLPEGLFSTCTNTTHFTCTFADCTSLESIPENLLSACAEVTYVDGMFVGCTALKTIPEKLFANCPKIGTFEETFAECTALESIPEKLFSALSESTKSVTFTKCFYGCSALKSIPASLFDAVRRINFIDNCFNGCTALTGESPYTMIGDEKVHLYERTKGTDFPIIPSNTTAHADCFAGCEGLSDYTSMPSAWR